MKDLSPEAIILKELVKPERIEETHISYAMITDEYVYKLKKPVDFGFLDYRLSKSRRRYCILEKELNSRFSKDVYLDVLKIIKFGKEFKLVPHTNTMFAIDYVVKMRRIKDEDFFSTKLKNGEINSEKAYEIGRQIASLFRKIETPIEQAMEHGSYDVVKFNCEENFTQTEKYVGNLIDEKIFDFIKNKTLKFLNDNKSLFDKRVKEGFVKDGHGDLRIDHVYFDGEEIGLLDCIEFNRRFRFNDVVSEIAFLSMELDTKGYYEISDNIVEGFFSVFSDENSRKLLNFYRCYRAYVRAKVTCFLLEEKGEEWDGYEVTKQNLDRLLDAAFVYALNMDGLKNYVFYGIMGSGKTKNSKYFTKKFPFRHINTDVERKLLFGYNPEESVKVDFNKGLYSYENSLKTYGHIAKKVNHLNRIGRAVVIDGSFSKKEYFSLLDEQKLRYYKIMFTAPLEVLKKRLIRREDKVSVSDGRLELLDKQVNSFETGNMADLVVETTGSIEENIKRIVEFILDNEA
ncbi:gluconate kinase [Deferribacter autotrophicus]|uniref:Gluconate kinase n=1 Tax=Deferribacter autotrophicus TaxID=500465 RepID=A0A5A8F3U9_9BACT|nr:AAA family ATPase [Deferribacter autotrophicus]KAA0258141.1 gluconate kinase [Deferribacter autotrophicus]